MAFIGNNVQTQSFVPAIDYFSGNGSTVAFTLSRPVASVAQIQVVIDNVAQNPSTAFTVSGNTLTFTSAPLTGSNNIYVYYTSPITNVIAPSQGTVQPSSLSTGGPTWSSVGNFTTLGTSSDSVGNLRSAPLNSQTSAYVLVASDSGKAISITTGGVTVPNSVLAAGNIVTIYNNSGSSQTITQGTGLTLQWAGQSTSSTGNRTLGLYGICSILFISSSAAVISGAGLT